MVRPICSLATSSEEARQMTEQSMVEKVARAICDSDFCDNGDHGAGEAWAGMDEQQRDYYRDNARAAIKALREPTEAMIATAAWEDGEYTARTVWGQMIDAALAEGETDG